MSVRVTVEDLSPDHKETESVVVRDGDYLLVTVAPCYRHHVQVFPTTGTHIVTIRKGDNHGSQAGWQEPPAVDASKERMEMER